jgi:hypothetical protein
MRGAPRPGPPEDLTDSRQTEAVFWGYCRGTEALALTPESYRVGRVASLPKGPSGRSSEEERRSLVGGASVSELPGAGGEAFGPGNLFGELADDRTMRSRRRMARAASGPGTFLRADRRSRWRVG